MACTRASWNAGRGYGVVNVHTNVRDVKEGAWVSRYKFSDTEGLLIGDAPRAGLVEYKQDFSSLYLRVERSWGRLPRRLHMPFLHARLTAERVLDIGYDTGAVDELRATR